MIETDGERERELGKSMPAARYDDDDMISSNYSYLMIIIIFCLHRVIWFQVFQSNTDNSNTYIV